jgi:hypothetical protein
VRVLKKRAAQSHLSMRVDMRVSLAQGEGETPLRLGSGQALTTAGGTPALRSRAEALAGLRMTSKNGFPNGFHIWAECGGSQVSAQRTDANLGHQAALRVTKKAGPLRLRSGQAFAALRMAMQEESEWRGIKRRGWTGEGACPYVGRGGADRSDRSTFVGQDVRSASCRTGVRPIPCRAGVSDP